MNTKRLPRKLVALLTLAAMPLAVHATIIPVLSIDFGASGGTAYTGTNTPAHAAGLLTAEVTFTQSGSVQHSGSLTSHGNTVGFGARRGGTATDYNLGTNGLIATSSTTAITEVTGSGVFATDLTNDGLISLNTEANPRGPIGAMFNISGLANGDYALFVVAHIGNNSPFAAQNMRVSYEIRDGNLVGNTAITTAAPLSQMTTLSGSTTVSWIEGNNYARFNFTIDDDTPDTRTLVIASNDPTGVDQTTLSAMQLIAIPEPGSLMLVGIALGSLMIFRRRK